MPDELKRGSISMWQALANGLGANGPAAVMALYFVGLAGLVGGATPLVVVLAFFIYLAMTVIMYEWSKIVSSSHSWAAMHKRGFGSPVAMFGAFTYWYYYMTFVSGFAALGFSSFAYVIFPSVGAAYPWLWAPISVIIILETSILIYFGVSPSTKYSLYTGIAEVVFIIITSIVLIVIAGHANTLSVFTAAPVGNDWTLILVSMILGITTFGGMNSVIPVAEETKNPKKNVPRALAYLAIILGITLIMSAYAQTIIYGPGNMFDYAGLPDPGITVYSKYFGPVVAGILAFFVLNSFNDSAVSAGNNAIRMAYGSAREGMIFPKSFAKLNKYGTPGINIWFTAAINIVVLLAAGFWLGPLFGGLFLIVSNAFFNYLNHSIAAVGLFRYHYKHKTLKVFRHVVIPVIVVGSLATAIIYAIYPAPEPPLNYSAYLAGIWLLLFFVVYFVEKIRKPKELAEFGDFSL